jgi:hypothetical protein
MILHTIQGRSMSATNSRSFLHFYSRFRVASIPHTAVKPLAGIAGGEDVRQVVEAAQAG